MPTQPSRPVEPLAEVRARRLAGLSLSYPEVRAAVGELPAGYAHLDRARLIGNGPDRFAEAAELVLGWRVQTGAGLRVRAEHRRIEPGDLAEVGIGVGAARLWSPCRVVTVVDEPRRRGFAYGTLPGHPETGEEAFLVTRDAHDQVWLRIRAFSRPGTAWSRLGAPAARLVQARVTERYLRALD